MAVVEHRISHVLTLDFHMTIRHIHVSREHEKNLHPRSTDPIQLTNARLRPQEKKNASVTVRFTRPAVYTHFVSPCQCG